MAELALSVRAAPLFAAMLAGCGGQQANVAHANIAVLPKAEPTPVERAQALVRQRLDARAVSFEGIEQFASGGAAIVCGRYRLADRPAQRFIAVGEEDVFVEGDFTGDMDQAIRETCRNA